MYFVITEKDQITIATTDYEDIANMIAKNFIEDCIVRNVEMYGTTGHKTLAEVRH